MRCLRFLFAAALVAGCTALADTDVFPPPREDGAVEGDGGRTDSGRRDGGGDSGSPPGGDPVGFGSDLGGLTLADYSCLGTRTAPDQAGAAVSFDGIVTDFVGGALDSVTVQFFPDNAPPADGSCGTCTELVSDPGGTVSVSDNQGSWYAYRIPGGTNGGYDLIEVVQFNAVAPFGGSQTFMAMQQSTFGISFAVVGVTLEAGTATMRGAVLDCGDMPIANATVRLFGSSGEIALGFTETGPREFYFNGLELPSASQRMTHVDGLYGATNVPLPAGDIVRVEIWGTLTAGGSAELLGCEQVLVLEDGMTIVDVGPLRSDGPAACRP